MMRWPTLDRLRKLLDALPAQRLLVVGDVVLDPFNGWGTTCVAAKRLGRRYVGIDLSPGFCAEAARRLEETPLAPRVMMLDR